MTRPTRQLPACFDPPAWATKSTAGRDSGGVWHSHEITTPAGATVTLEVFDDATLDDEGHTYLSRSEPYLRIEGGADDIPLAVGLELAAALVDIVERAAVVEIDR